MTTALGFLFKVLGKIPLVIGVSITHVLGLSPTRPYLGFRSDLIVAVMRSFFAAPLTQSVSDAQASAMRFAARGHIWVSEYTVPLSPETSVRDEAIKAIDALRDPLVQQPTRLSEQAPVEAEWTGFRAGVPFYEPQPEISEKAKYAEMMKEVTQPTTVLYLHGGGFYLGDPATHRPFTQPLAELTGGRCYSVRYRLAPQHAFPAPMLDGLVSYMALLYPPPDAFHEPVKPEHLVIGGDSAGGHAALALLQLIMQLRRQNSRIMWFGELREVPMPASVICVSPFFDFTQGMPSWKAKNPFDYFPTPEPGRRLRVPPCDAWPTNPPREDYYIHDDEVTHPLATLPLCDSWEGAPPVHICVGWERLADDGKFMAMKLATVFGVKVRFEEYEAMPHCFPAVLQHTRSATACLESLARFIKASVDDPQAMEARAVRVGARTQELVPLQFEDLSELSDEDMKKRIMVDAEAKAAQKLS